jgi:integrase
VFMSERDAPMAPKSFHALIQRLGERAGMPFPIHPHMLRHACGHELANKGHDIRALQAHLYKFKTKAHAFDAIKDKFFERAQAKSKGDIIHRLMSSS